MHPGEEDNRGISWTLIPGYDGSLITADKNVVQGKWTANYQIIMGEDNTVSPQAASDFALNAGYMAYAEQFVRQSVTQAILKEVARTPVDDFIKGRINYDALRSCAQQFLDRLNTGLRIGNITGERCTVARCLQDDFRAVTQAESEKAEHIEAAKCYRTETLNETAGADFQTIIGAIADYDATMASGDLT